MTLVLIRKIDVATGVVSEVEEDITLPVTAEPVPRVISRRQFFQQAAVAGLITRPEALAAVKSGDIPEIIQVFISGLPEAAQFDAEMLVSGAQSFDRSHDFATAFGAALGQTSEFMDEFWRAAARL